MATPPVPPRFLQAVVRKAADWFFPRSALGFGTSFYHPMSGIETAGPEVGLGLIRSSVLMAPIQWLMRAWPEAELVVRQRKRGQTEYSVIDGHPLAELLRMPNAYYSGEALWMVTVWSWCIFGNVYWRIVSTRGGVPQELWWVPPWQIYPAWPTDGREFISHYEYTPEGSAPQQLSLDQVIHFRHSLDPANPRVGLSPIASVLREIAVDDEASSWVAALLRNMAVPGLLITPMGEAHLSPEEVERVKRYLQSRTTGEFRGEPIAFGAPTSVQKLSFSPSEMDLSPPRNTAEERVCACFGLPPAVVGFGTGLDTTKVGATMQSMVGLAWSNALIPPQRIIAGELQRSLLPRFERQETLAREIVDRRLARLEVGWDYSGVLAMQEDAQTKLARFNMGVQGGWIKVSEARAAANLEVSDEDDIYLRPRSMEPVDPLDQLPEPEPVPLALSPGGLANGQRPEDASEEETEAEQEAASYAEGVSLKQGTRDDLILALLAQHAPRMDQPPRAVLRLMTKLFRAQEAFEPRAAELVAAALRRLGRQVAEEAKTFFTFKQDLQAYIDSQVITEGVPMAQVTADLSRVYEQLAVYMAEQTIELINAAMDLEPVSVDFILREVRGAAIERVGVLHVSQQVRQKVQEIIEAGRVAGLTDSDLVEAIAEQVPAGRFRSVETRAVQIARTELRLSMNSTTLEYARQIGADRVLMLDARLGPTDAVCEAMNGLVITLAEAKLVMPLEHPSGTRSFAILTPTLTGQTGMLA